MKLTNARGNREGTGWSKKAGREFCRKIRAQIAGVKEMIFAESNRAFSAPERLVRLALNEAEAAAWQTQYPHLVFPALATEKVQAVAAWGAHQRFVRPDRLGSALAA
jgi:hypothetical protein